MHVYHRMDFDLNILVKVRATREHEKSTNRNQGMLYHLHASLKQTNEMPVIHYRHNSRQAKSTCCLYVHKS